VSKKDIVGAWDGGANTVDAIAHATRATTGCGGCKEVVCGLVDWLNASDPETPDPADSGRSTPVTQRNITAPSSS
jgi:assimilatory nitrate reductase electron transfer subunit